MTYSNLFDPNKFFNDDGQNYFGYKPGTIPKLQAIPVEGPVKELVEHYRDNGESVTVLESYKSSVNKEPHTVAWIGRRGIDEFIYEPFQTYQLVCDCLPLAPDDLKDEALFTCQAVSRALSARAFLIRERLSAKVPLYGRYNNEGLPKKSSKKVLRDMVGFMLDQVHYHPHAWQANTASGTQLVGSVAAILEADPSRTLEIVKKMAKKDKVELYGDGIIRVKQPETA